MDLDAPEGSKVKGKTEIQKNSTRKIFYNNEKRR